MYQEILSLLLQIQNPISKDTKSPWALIPQTRRENVVAFCKKYPWTVDQDFCKRHQLEIVTPKICPKIELYMQRSAWQPLFEELSMPCGQDKYYPTNYWERLAVLTHMDINSVHVFVDVMLNHGFKFTPGVTEQLLLRSCLEPHSKRIIQNKILHDQQRMLEDL